MKTFKQYWGSWNVVRIVYVYFTDYLKYPQHFRARIQEITRFIKEVIR